tara:strand:- start:43 stop:432 length:390 start_codon:yes stop_codon:yes gene_type:complete
MDYSYSKTIYTTFRNAEEMIKKSLFKIGFGILTEISINDAFKEKLNISFKKYKILGACNPTLAHQAIEKEPNIGILMPCNIIIIDNEDGSVNIIFPQAKKILEVTNNNKLNDIIQEVDILLESAFNNIK